MGGQMEFQLGNVANRAFGSAIRNFWVFAALTALLVVLPQIAITFLVGDVQGNVDPSSLVPILVFGGVVAILGTFLLQGAIVRGAIVDFNSGRASFGDCLSTGLRHFFPIIVITILVGIGVSLGLLLLIVPGIMIAIAWLVAVPARVVENTGIIDSIRRSSALTRGNRWSLFWLLVIYLIVVFVISTIVNFLALVGGAASGVSYLAIALSSLTTLLTSILGSTGIAAIYFELRQSKEGIGAEELAKVFD
eukprot:s1_g878.t1